MSATSTIFIVGGTGAQGIPVIEELTKEPERYKLRVLTRDSNSRRAKELAALGSNVTFLEEASPMKKPSAVVLLVVILHL